MNNYGIMLKLWEHANDKLTIDDLNFFAGASGYAEHIAFQLESTVEGIGCLVNKDGDSESPRAGNFQDPDSVASLLFGISHSISNIRALIIIGEEAKHRLDKIAATRIDTVRAA